MTRAGDLFRTFHEENHERVRRVLERIVGAQEAEDLTQIVFAKAAKALPEFRGEAQSATWLYRIAANTASDWLRSRAGQEARVTAPLAAQEGEAIEVAPGAAEASEAPTPEQELSQKEMRECLRGEIGKLPETLRTAFMLSALAGSTDAEIAETLGISLEAAKVRLHRARRAFRQIIEARCDFYRNELSCKPNSPECCSPARAASAAP